MTRPAGREVPSRLIIASRESRLAMWQAEHVQGRLQALYPHCQVDILGMTTEGDRTLDRALHEIGGKGLFTKELELALLDGRADLAVHSLKDVPMQLPDGFSLATVLTREDPRDAFVSNAYASLADLPAGARVGTSSLRRAAQVRNRYPALTVLPLRGNINTRLAKLDAGDYEAILLAAAGLKRIGMASRIRQILPPSDSLPAAGQGALGIEIREIRDDLSEWLAPLNDPASQAQVYAERAVSRALGGSCRVPLAAFCELRSGGGLLLRARVASLDGAQVLEASAQCFGDSPSDGESLGQRVSADLIGRGALALLAQCVDGTGRPS